MHWTAALPKSWMRLVNVPLLLYLVIPEEIGAEPEIRISLFGSSVYHHFMLHSTTEYWTGTLLYNNNTKQMSDST